MDYFSTLAEVADSLKAEYSKGLENWENSPFTWLHSLPSRTLGKLGEHLACQLLRKIAPRDWEFRWPSGTPYYDILAIGPNCKIRLEVKFSTLWRTGVYKFQQLRDQPYDLLICLGLSPQEAHLWVFSKNEAFHYATPQHGGKEGEDTYWLSFPPGELQEYGGKLEAGIERLIQYFK